MSRLLYEKSLSYNDHLIIPFVFGTANGQPLYSYKLLSGAGHKGKFHQLENPGSLYSSSIDSILNIAKELLDQNLGIRSKINDGFKHRYTYHHHLIIVSGVSGTYFYDHYPPDKLQNIAAPKLFKTETDCLNWIKQGLGLHPAAVGGTRHSL